MADHLLTGKIALVAGGAKNLGGLIARDLAAQGAAGVAIHYNSAATKADAEATAEAVRAAGATAVIMQGDLTSAAAVSTLFAGALMAFGRLDIAIENRPLATNPKSSEMTALGLVRLIENRVRTLVR